MKKIFLILSFLITSSLYAYDPIQEAILESDYDSFVQQYNPKEVAVAAQHAYWAIADDIVKNRSTNLAFDWCKAFASKKFVLSALFILNADHIFNILDRFDFGGIPCHKAFLAQLGFKSTAALLFFWALADGNKYYKQLQEKIKDAERIKFLIMNS